MKKINIILYYFISDKSINKWTSGRIEEKIDNLLKIKLENTAKNKPFIIIDKDSEFLKLKENQYESKNEEQVFSSNTDRGRNSEENDTSTDRSNTENNAVAY